MHYYCRMSRFIHVAVALTGLLFLASLATAGLSPAFLQASLSPGQCIEETKTVDVPEVPPRADVVFAFDLTGSMSGITGTAKARAVEILTALRSIPGVDVEFGVMSYMDYPGVYSSCDYGSEYGDAGWGDYAYRLNQSVTNDTTSVVNAINSLVNGSGSDGPQDYGRIFYESYSDPEVRWRTGAKRILVNFGDSVPHDCDLNEGLGADWAWSTGGDPGRDAIMGTADDLDLQKVLAEMKANGVVLLECHTTSYANEHWSYWTGITGGNVYITTSGTLVDDIGGAVLTALTAPVIYDLHLQASGSFGAWLTCTPGSYPEANPGDAKTFDISICVPEGTPEGTYLFTINAVDAAGVSYGEQIVSLEVKPLHVYVDVKPGSCPNPIQMKDKGVTTIALLGTDEFDVTEIDPASIRVGRAGVSATVSVLRYTFEDVATPFDGEACDCHSLGGDGRLDLVLKFAVPELVATLDLSEVAGDTVPLIVTGTLKNGRALLGADCVRVQ